VLQIYIRCNIVCFLTVYGVLLLLHLFGFGVLRYIMLYLT